MSDPREQLKSMLQDLINDRTEQAEVTIHNYLVAKTQALAGFGAAPEAVEAPEATTDDQVTPE